MRSPRKLMHIAGLALSMLMVTAGAGGAQSIVSARYAEPDRSYSHYVLGRDYNWKRLEVERDTGQRLFLTAPKDLVFEDTAPRLIDIDEDARFEVLVVESGPGQGARLAIYGVEQGALVLKAATPHIGRSNRWYAPVGVADLDQDGTVEVAFVDRPHLAKILRIWRYDPDKMPRFYEVATLNDVSNHRIGEATITGGVRQCNGQTEIVLAAGDWSRIVAVTFDGQTTRTRDHGDFSPDALSRLMDCA